MSLPPSPALLRLREADVVRLCGLDGAARGLELVSRRAVSHQRRNGGRLSAVVEDGQPRRARVELAAETSPGGMRWSCECAVAPEQSEAGASAGSLGCAHIAAILTAWVRSPSDFIAPAHVSEPAQYEPEATARRPRLAQPALLAPPPATRPRGASLADELARLQPAVVTAMAQRVLGVEMEERDAVAALGMALADATRVAGVVGRLEPGARELLASIRLLGGAVTAAEVAGIAERAGRAASAVRAETATLERHGLLFPVSGGATGGAQTAGSAAHPWRTVTGWRMPPELLAALPPRLPLTSSATLVAPSPVETSSRGSQRGNAQPRVVMASPRPLARALALLPYAPGPVGLDPAGRAEPSPAPARPPAPERHVMATLLAGEPPGSAIMAFARGAGVDAGLARMARRTLLWAREDPARQTALHLASLPASERLLALRAGFRLWRDAETGADLSDLEQGGAGVRVGVASNHPALRPAAIAAEVLEARRFALRLLSHMRVREWHQLDDVVDLVWRLHPGFLRGRQLAYDSPAWWLERSADRRPLRITESSEWMAGEGEYLRALIRGPLFWWGVCDLGVMSGAYAAFACRLTPLGAALLREEPRLPEEAEHALDGDWGPPALPTRDGGLAAQPLAAGYGLLTALTRWAGVREVAGGRLVFALSADRACAAFDAGEEVEALPRALVAAGVPGDARVVTAVRSRLAGWRAQYGKTRITTSAVVVEARDEAALREALGYAAGVDDHARHLGAGLAVIADADVVALRETLNRRGYHV